MVLVLVAGIYFCRWEISRNETEITVLPLNGGQAVFVSGGTNDWLIDCGNADAVTYTLKDFLRSHCVSRVHRLALTEGASRNCAGAASLEELFGVDELWTSPAHFRSKVYDGIVADFDKKSPAPHKVLEAGAQYGCWRVLWPTPTTSFSRANNGALVLMGNFPKGRVLLLSDLGSLGQTGLLLTTNDLRADIVVSGLPDEGEPLSDQLLAAIRPKVIVIVDSDTPFAKHVGPGLRDRLADQNVPVIYTRNAGAVKITMSRAGWKAQTLDGQKFAARNQ